MGWHTKEKAGWCLHSTGTGKSARQAGWGANEATGNAERQAAQGTGLAGHPRGVIRTAGARAEQAGKTGNQVSTLFMHVRINWQAAASQQPAV